MSSLSVNGDVGNTQVTITGFTAPVTGLTVVGQGATSVTAQDLGSSPVQSLTVEGSPDPNVNQVQIVGTPPPQVSLQNVAPTISLPADATFALGKAWSLDSSFRDPGTDETWTAAVDYGDGSGSQPLSLAVDKSFVLGHIYAQNSLHRGDRGCHQQSARPWSCHVHVTATKVPSTVALRSSAITPLLGVDSMTFTAAIGAAI